MNQLAVWDSGADGDSHGGDDRGRAGTWPPCSERALPARGRTRVRRDPPRTCTVRSGRHPAAQESLHVCPWTVLKV